MNKNLSIFAIHLLFTTYALTAQTAAVNESIVSDFLLEYHEQLPHFVDDLHFFNDRATLLRARPHGTDAQVSNFFSCFKIDQTEVDGKKVRTLNIGATTSAIAMAPPLAVIFEMLHEDYESYWQSKFFLIDAAWTLQKKVLMCRGTVEALRTMGQFFSNYSGLMRAFYRVLNGRSGAVFTFFEEAPQKFVTTHEEWSARLQRFELAQKLESNGPDFKPMQGHPDKGRSNKIKAFWKAFTRTGSSDHSAKVIAAIPATLPPLVAPQDQVVPTLSFATLTTSDKSGDLCLFSRNRHDDDDEENEE